MLCTQLPQHFNGNAIIFHSNFYGNFIQDHFQLFIKICEDMKKYLSVYFLYLAVYCIMPNNC